MRLAGPVTEQSAAAAARIIERARYFGASRLRRLKVASFVSLMWAASFPVLARVFVPLGFLHALIERGFFPIRGRSWRAAIVVRAIAPLIRGWLKLKYPLAPGWNDYYMTLWLATGSPKHLHEVFRRASLAPGHPGYSPDVAVTARHMVKSLRMRYIDLDVSLRELEAAAGVPLVEPVAEMFLPGGGFRPCPHCGCAPGSVACSAPEPCGCHGVYLRATQILTGSCAACGCGPGQKVCNGCVCHVVRPFPPEGAAA